MANKLTWRSIKIHRSYTVDDASRALGVCKPTVRRWLTSGKLAVIDDQRPALILGSELIAFLKARRKPKTKCRIGQCYCFTCKAPRGAAGAMAELVKASNSAFNVCMLCEVCSRAIYKRCSARQIQLLAQEVSLSAPQAIRHLIETTHPSLNVHFEKGGQDIGKAPPEE